MPLFKAEATIFTVHGKEAEKSIRNFQIREMNGAMKAFLRACLPRIPVRTGFLRGAFRPMRNFYLKNTSGTELNPILEEIFLNAEHADFIREYVDTLQKSDSRGKRLSAEGMAVRLGQFQREMRASTRRFRKTKAGRKLKDVRHQEWYYYAKRKRALKTSANALQLVQPKDPSEVIKTIGMTSTIQFDIQISYYRINDYYSRITGAPWRSLDAGFQASLNYLEQAADRYPYLSEVLTTQRIYLRGSRIGKEDGNQVADYRRRFGTTFLDPAGSIRGAKATPYPASSTKKQIY